MNYITIKNWDRWQNYRKDRGQPPWIKVHRRLLRNPEWVSMTDAERGQLVVIWLLAADHDGVIPASPEIIQKLGYMESTPNISKFIKLDFLTPNGCQHDANMTTTCQPNVCPEAEAEADKSREESEQPPPSVDSVIKPLDPKCKKINSLPKRKENFNPYQFIQWCLNHKYHPDAISHTLDALIANWDEITKPFAYAKTIITKESGNFYEKDAKQCADEDKTNFLDLIDRLKAVREYHASPQKKAGSLDT